MKKLMLGSAAGLLALLLVAALVAGRSIDAMAKRGVEAGTRYATGVETRLDSIRIGLFRGEANLTQLRLANPEGFSDEPFLDLAEGHVAVTIGSLRRSEVELPRLILNDAHLRLERNAAGQTNYDAILEQLGRLSRADAPPDEDGRRYVIREVELNNVRVTLSGFPGAPTQTLRLDPIVLRNVGSDTHRGLVMSELAAVVVSAVFASLLERPDQLPGMIVSGLGEGLQHVGGLAEQGIAAIGGLSEGARAALQEVGVPLEEARDVLRGLLRSRGDD